MFMVEFLQEFDSYYWHTEFDDPELRAAYASFTTATTQEEFERAFLVLLRSEDTVARGTALDFFDRAETTGRFGEPNPFAAHEREVIAVARELLRQPPRPEDDHTYEGANHASALLALRHDAGPEDTETLLRVLERAPEGSVLENALMVAHTIFEDAPEPEPRLVALVSGLAFNRTLEQGYREEALRTLRYARSAEVDALLVRALGEDEEPGIRRCAADALASGTRFYAHRTVLERLDPEVAGGNLPYLLAEGPHSLYWEGCEAESEDLRAAHRELRSPTGEEAHRRAFRAMLHSGRPVAVGIALDHSHQDDGLGRFGLATSAFATEVTTVAREVLRQPLSGTGAQHAGALHALEWYAGPEHAAELTTALRARGPALVRERAVLAAQRCLERWPAVDEDVVAALEELVFDDAVEVAERADAVVALFDLPSPAVTAVLLRAVRSPEPPIQVEAAVGLTYEHLIEDHRDLLRSVVASWPEDAGHRARIVWSELRE
ncbi:hypothetical protein [Streptomyces sp. NPDC048636]|uniref:HEAT repeat domain-containing protein n=1 Tax=Streptomyces sp. NPDC048636 TaxID=3155762 RepID=UPI003442C635